MSNVKLLNLDELNVVRRVVQIGGKEYPLADQSLKQMLSRIELAKNLSDNQDTPEVFLKDMRQTLLDLLPTASTDLVEGLSIQQAVKLIEFANESDTEFEKRADEAGAETEAGQAEGDQPQLADAKKS